MTRVNEHVGGGMLEMFPTDKKKGRTKRKFPEAMQKEKKKTVCQGSEGRHAGEL